MNKFNASLVSKLVLMASLGLGVSACSSQQEDAEARGDIETPATVQDEVVDNAMSENEAAASQNLEAQSDLNDAEMDEPEVEAEELSSIENTNSEDNLDDREVLEGDEKEEHLSTY